MGWTNQGTTSITLPTGAVSGPRIVIGSDIPAELITYYNVGLAKITSMILWYYGTGASTHTYHYYGVVDLGGGVPPGSIVRGNVLAGVVFEFDEYVGNNWLITAATLEIDGSVLLNRTAGGVANKIDVISNIVGDIVATTKLATEVFNRYQLFASGYAQWGSGAAAPDTNLYRQSISVLGTDSNFAIATAGAGLKIKEGANAKMGVIALVGGTIVVNTTAVTATSRIFLTSQAPGGTPGWLQVSARVVGTSFTILSSNALDTSTVAWLIIEIV
jgi:hypothetical protein